MANLCGTAEGGSALHIKEVISPVSSLPHQDILQLLESFVSTWTSCLFTKLQIPQMEPPALGRCCWVPRPLHLNNTIHGALLEWRSNQELHFSTALRPPQWNYLPSSTTINRKIKKSTLDSSEKRLFWAIERKLPLPAASWSSTRILLGIFPSHLQETLPRPALTTSLGWKHLKKL